MAPKRKKGKSNRKTSPPETAKTTDTQTDILLFDSSASTGATPRNVSLNLILEGSPPGSEEFTLMAYFNGVILLSQKWGHGETLESNALPINLSDRNHQLMVANSPLILLLRTVGTKASKDQDPLNHPDNFAGANIDLFPLLLGEQTVCVRAPLVSITTGERTECSVEVRVVSLGTKDNNLVPLVLTMVSVHCLPAAKENTFYTSAIGLDDLHEPKALNFNLALSSPLADKIVFAADSVTGHVAKTAMNLHTDDMFVPNDLRPQDKPNCHSVYWNAMRRVLVDPMKLIQRLSLPFMIEVAGVPRTGKVDIRGRYTGFVDAGVLLEPGQMGVTICSKLELYNEANIPLNIGPLLELPITSAKPSARDVDPNVTDEFGHSCYAVIRFDLTEPLIPKTTLENLYETMGFPLSADANVTRNKKSESESVRVVSAVDVNMIRKEGGALAVHKELSGLACKGTIPMNQGIKRTAANHLLMRVRAMLKSFPPGECSYLDFQDTVTGHHAASRRAVTASFAPQPPPPHLPDKVAAARCRIAGDARIADKHLETSLYIAEGRPNALISKTLRCLEDGNDVAAKKYLHEALSMNTNRYLLWIYGGLQFDKENDGNTEIAGAALRISAKGDRSDGTANAIGWAALHTFHHCNGNIYAAFVAAKRMRKAFSLPVEWKKVLARWTESSGEEEAYWIPEVVSSDNPLLIAAAFFLCLRCYKFSEKLLECVEQGCATLGSTKIKCKISPDVYYLRAASHILRCEFHPAMLKILDAIKTFGPTPKMSEIRATCLACSGHWNEECEKAFIIAEQSGAELCSSTLYLAALAGFRSDPTTALQRAVRAHKNNPSGHTALLIGRIYVALDKQWFAERWLAAAVNTEPLLADGWAMLALLAMYDRNINKARVLWRTAKQAGPISTDIEEEVNQIKKVVKLDQLSDCLVKHVCIQSTT